MTNVKTWSVNKNMLVLVLFVDIRMYIHFVINPTALYCNMLRYSAIQFVILLTCDHENIRNNDFCISQFGNVDDTYIEALPNGPNCI